MLALLDKLDRRQAALLGGGAFLLLIAALVSYVVWPTIKLYRTEAAALRVLEQAVLQGQGVGAELTRVEAEVAALDRTLHGDTANLPEKQFEAFVVGRLQTISWRNNVELLSVEPGAGDTIQTFKESLFEVELSGDYFDLFAWLNDIGHELGFVIVKEWEMRADEDVATNPRLAARLTIASYRIAPL